MIRNEEKYQQAVEFRKRGFTYSEIAKICDVSKGTISNWLSKKAFSKRVKKDNTERAARDNKKRISLVNKARKVERETRYSEAVRSAETEFKHYKRDPLFVAAVVAYISAGDMSHTSQIRLTTRKSELHRFFISFLCEYLGVDKKDVSFWVLVTGNIAPEKILKWWSHQIGLSVAQFGKTQFLHSETKPLHYGTGNTIIGSTVLKRKLIRWSELLQKELRNK